MGVGMELSDRQREELGIIGNRDFTPPSVLATIFKVSERTIRSDVSSLNALLPFDRRVLLRRGHGYYIEKGLPAEGSTRNSIGGELSRAVPLDSIDQRKRFILGELLLSDKPVTLGELASSAYVAEDTLKTYMSSIRRVLGKYGLDCIAHRNKGILVYGPEEGRRDCFLDECVDRRRINYISEFDSVELNACAAVDLQEVRQIVSRMLAGTQLSATDRGFKSLVLDVGITAQRIHDRHFIGSSDVLEEIPIASVAVDCICDQLSPLLASPVDKAERGYLYKKVVKHTDAGESKVDAGKLRASIDALLNMTYVQYSVDLRNDEELKASLFNHLSLTFSEGFDIASPNPLLQTIKQEYPLPYDIALASTNEVFNRPPFELNEGQIGYIALHIGAALNRMRNNLSNACDVVLICGEGRSVRGIFESRIKALFGDEVNIVRSMSFRDLVETAPIDLRADIVISTVPLEGQDLSVPYLFVGWNLPSHDIQVISRTISQVTNYGDDVIEKFFCERSFVRVRGRVDEEELLGLMCSELVSAGVAEGGLLDKVMQREQISDTSIGDIMAIPHPLTPCSNQTRISVAVMDEPVKWGVSRKPVRIVMLLAIKPSAAKDLERLYDLLTQIIGNPAIQKSLVKAESYTEFIAELRRSCGSV